SELAGVEENPLALGALVHHDVPFDTPEVPHHDDVRIAGTVAPLLRVYLYGRILLDVEQRFTRRLVRLVDLAERPFVEPQPAAAALAGLDLHIAHRDLGHLGTAGRAVHGDASLARKLGWWRCESHSYTRCATSKPSRTGITDAFHLGSV